MKCSVVAFILCLAFCKGAVIKCIPGSKDESCIPDRLENDRVEECSPETEWESECHRCSCSDSGQAMCSKIQNCYSANEHPIRCKPDTYFNRDCNTCMCLPSGMAVCTLAVCLSSHDRDNFGGAMRNRMKRSNVCNPGSRYKIECNTCLCSEDGQSFVCTMMGCDVGDDLTDVELLKDGEERISKEQTDKPSQNVCKPRRTFPMGCNTCLCNIDGTNYSCTNKPCPLPADVEIFHELTVKRSAAPLKTVVCTANRMFIKDCNTCWCNEDGTSYFCTRKVCVEELPEEVSEPVKIHEVNGTCRPDEVFELDCNTCRCNPDGLSYSCTRRACPNEGEELPLRRKTRSTSQQTPRTPDVPQNAQLLKGTPKNCQPGQEFRMDCNKCLCDNEGQNFSCTRIDCAALNSNGNGGTRVRREVTTREDSGCNPGSVFSQECNTCHCTADGGHAICTLKQCIKDDKEYELNQPDSDPNFRCNPGEQFKRDCNDCTCSANGRSVFCTLRVCDFEI